MVEAILGWLRFFFDGGGGGRLIFFQKLKVSHGIKIFPVT